MNRIVKIIIVLLPAISCLAEHIAISGTITDMNSVPLADVLITLNRSGLTALSGPDGSFSISGTVDINTQVNNPFVKSISARMVNGLVNIATTEKADLELTAHSLQGKIISHIRDEVNAGTHSFMLPGIGAGVYLITIKAGSDKLIIKAPCIGQYTGATGQLSNNPKADIKEITYAVSNEIIEVTKDGYLNYRTVLHDINISGLIIALKASAGTVTDNDGNVYQTVVIGNQEWMAEHLRTTTYNDGSKIPHVTDAGVWSSCITPAYCFYDNTTDTEKMKTYGALYNWYAVNTKKLAPDDWHVPTESDWNTLLNYLIDNGYNYDGSTTGNKVGKSLASQSYWDSNGDHYDGSIGLNKGSNNRTGFNAHPGGYRHINGKFIGRKYQGLWCDMWSTAEVNETNAWCRNLAHTANDLIKLDYNKGTGFSVRLVKD